MRIKGVDVQDFAWDVIGALPQLYSKEFTDAFKAKKIQEYFKDFTFTKEEALEVLKAVKGLGRQS